MTHHKVVTPPAHKKVKVVVHKPAQVVHKPVRSSRTAQRKPPTFPVKATKKK